MPTPDIGQIKSDIANVTDGSPWGAGEWLSLSRLLAELGILTALVGPMVCSVDASEDEPAGEVAGSDSSG